MSPRKAIRPKGFNLLSVAVIRHEVSSHMQAFLIRAVGHKLHLARISIRRNIYCLSVAVLSKYLENK